MLMNLTNDLYLNEDLEKAVRTDYLPWEEFRGKRILVTGATGFVGSLLCKCFLFANRLLDLDIQIYGAVRSSVKAQKIYGRLTETAGLELFEWDIRYPCEQEMAVDYIFHCAGVTASKVMVDHPVKTLLTAVDGTHNVLELARNRKVKSFVYLSSMEVYGTFNSSDALVSERDSGYINPLEVRSNYPESKRLCENMCIAYFSEYGIPVKIARLAQVFGAGVLESENRVFAQFARCVIRGENIILHTEGLSEGNYCYSGDVLKALVLLMLRGKSGEAYNISNPETHTTIREMARMVCQDIAKGKIDVVYDIPPSNQFGYAADTKLKLDSGKMQQLGWKPEVGLREAYIRLIGRMRGGTMMR